MVDEVDQANENVARDEAMAIKRATQYQGPSAKGKCLAHDCDEPLPAGQRWCDVECRNRWELKRKIYNHE
jgi:hypothetical protein